MMRSLEGKLSAGLFISLITAFVIFWVFVSFSIRYLTEEYIYTRLAHDSETLLSVFIKNASNPEKDTARLGSVYQQPFSGHYYQINIGEQSIRSRSLWDQSLDLRVDESKQIEQLYAPGPQQQNLLILVSHYMKKDQKILIAVAEDFTPVEDSISSFQLYFTFSMIVVLALLVGLQVGIIRRGLTPLIKLQEDLKELERGNIRRLETHVPSELSTLVMEINDLHSALESRLLRHRNALADLAHTLKKPLTVIQQLSKDPNLESLPEIRAVLERQAITTKQLTQRILNRARLAGTIQAERPFDYKKDLSGLIDTLKMMYRDKAINIKTEILTENQCQFDREDILELLGNLLDNACKWASQKVTIKISQSQTLNFIIEDDGPGAPESSLHALNQRGVRLDETVEGHGLGLAIVSDIVKHYNGIISYGKSAHLGGFQASIDLPLR